MNIIKRALCLIIAIAVIYQVNTFYSDAFGNDSGMEFGAHRGAESFAPENSIPAYEIAGQQGWEWAWIAQIKYSADGTLYVMHDNTVDRTTDGTGTMSELTDEYINSLHINYCPEYVYYSLNDFEEDDLRIPTLDEVVGICKSYGMKMCFRLGTLPMKISSDQLNLWESFKDILEKHNVSMEECSFSGLPNQVKTAASLFGNDIEYSCFISSVAKAQEYVDWFNDPLKNTPVTGKSAIISVNVLDEEQVRLLHDNGIKVYAYVREYHFPTMNQIREYESWGVDVLQNSSINYTDDNLCKHMVKGIHVFKEPTCTENGRCTIFCYLCGKILGYEDIPETGHTAGEWVTVSEPTYISEGERRQFCSVCGEIVDSQQIPTLIRTGWHEIDGDNYYFSSTGAMKTGWQSIEDDSGESSKYYFGTDGKMRIGHQIIGGKRYYFNEDGKMQTGWQIIDGDTYCIAPSGVLYTGWRTVKNSSDIYSRYYFGTNGKMHIGLQTIEGNKYFFDKNGEMQTGWQTIDGKKHYFDSKGAMKTGLFSIEGKKYYFGSDGVMFTKKLISVNGTKYYMGSDGIAYTNKLISVNGKKYYVGSNGAAYTKKLISVDGKKYYMGSDGVAYTKKLISVNGKKYYMGSNGVAYTNKLISVNGKKYYMGANGVAYKNRFASLNGKKYYFGSDCVMVTGKKKINGKNYSFNSSGVLIK